MRSLATFLVALGFSAPIWATQSKITRLTKHKTAKAPVRKGDEAVLKRLLENSKRLSTLLEAQTSDPTIWEGEGQILSGRTYRGLLLNSIVSRNLASPVLVEASPGQGLPYKTRFSCQGVTQNQRVGVVCSKMIFPDREVQITAQVLNLDGTAGLLGLYDDGKEDLIAGALLSDFSQGVLSAAQTRLNTPFGQVQDVGFRNQIGQGLINSGQTTSEILLDEMKQAEGVVTINSGSPVLVYFMEAVHEM